MTFSRTSEDLKAFEIASNINLTVVKALRLRKDNP